MKNLKRCRTKFGMTGKLAAFVLGAMLMAFPFASCNTDASGNGDEPNTPTTYIGTKAPSEEKEVGDIVFTDGSATPYTEDLTLDDNQKEAAIAIIFYKGTELNSGSDTSSRTLGVGLKHNRSGLAWCTSSANAYSVDIATIHDSDKNGSDNLKQIGDFLAANGSTDDTTGNGADGRYPAFYFAKYYANQEGSRVNGTSYADNWYLPSIAELFQIYQNGKSENKVFDIDKASELCGGDKFGTTIEYWSSSQYASDNNYAYLFFGRDNKSSNYIYVCAVREFN